ncbi:MAG: hypothetical protein ACR2ND_00415 [Solirubrobacteraceae bacterium]
MLAAAEHLELDCGHVPQLEPRARRRTRGAAALPWAAAERAVARSASH